MARGRELGLSRAGAGGRIRHHQGERRTRGSDHGSVDSSVPRARGRYHRRLWPECALDVQCHCRDRELRGDLRAQSRPQDSTWDGSRLEQALERGWPHVLTAVPIVSTRRNARVAMQAVGLGIMAAAIWWMARNTQTNLEQRGLSLGFGFLKNPANFEIGDTAGIPFNPANSFGRAILVGLMNTARVAVVGCVLSIVFGFVLG